MAALSTYEEQALREIALWKQGDMGWFGRAIGSMNRLAGKATDLLRKIPGVDWTIEHVATGLLQLVNEMVQDTVSSEKVIGELKQEGIAVQSMTDLITLDLEPLDRMARPLAGQYRTLAAAEGAATGMAGAAGILPDIFALVALNLKAAGEHAARYGFDIEQPEERLFALQLLDAMSHPTDIAKQLTLAPVIRVSRKLAQAQIGDAAQNYAISRAIRNAARTLGVHLTEAKLAQIVPLTGALVGGGFNAYYTSKVCDAAYHLYRERFLLRKYGLEALPGPRLLSEGQ